jgi:glycosyltransferase involved in cell wall biosynthesis
MGSILFISTMNGDPWGGSEEFWYDIALWMSKNGYKVGCCFFEWPSGKKERIDNLEKTGCKIWLLPNPRLAGNALLKMKIQKKGYRLLKEICSDQWSIICLSQGGYEDVTHRPFRFLYRHLDKFVIVYHNYNESHRLSKSRSRNLKKWTDNAILNMGDAGRIFEAVKKVSAIDIPRQFTFNNPLTIPYQAQPFLWPPKDGADRYMFTMLAQLDTRRKAQDMLIHALSDQKWKSRNWVLHLYGDGQDRSMLKDLVDKYDSGDKIKVMGHTNEVYKILQKTHLLFQITHIDAMPLSVTEAMNMARPCIVSNVGDMPLWIRDGKNGYIAPEVSQAAIDKTLERAWQEREKWEQMGLEAHRVFKTKYPQPYQKYYTDLLMNL